MVPKVDFVSAPGSSDAGVFRTGGPHALVTGLGLFSFDRERRRFRLQSVHPGHSVEEIRDNTGFEFDCADRIPLTPVPDPSTLEMIRKHVREDIAETYPQFASRLATV